jgi:hypothetical protein
MKEISESREKSERSIRDEKDKKYSGENKGPITDFIEEESFKCSEVSSSTSVPEVDEEIRSQTDTFPTKEEEE